ncbi:MAG: hypothetical protein ACK5LO_13565 [Leucobacter sp.]
MPTASAGDPLTAEVISRVGVRALSREAACGTQFASIRTVGVPE